MTCIIALECSDGAVIGGDYCGSNGFTYSSVVQPKVFKHSNMLYGYTTSFRFGQIIEHCLDNGKLFPPSNTDDVYRWLVTNFIPVLNSICKAEDYTKFGNALVVVNGQVWEIQNDMSVLRNTGGLAVVGCGVYHAQSSILTNLMLHYSKRQPTMNEAEKMLELAFKVTNAFVSGVSAECMIIKEPFQG